MHEIVYQAGKAWQASAPEQMEMTISVKEQISANNNVRLFSDICRHLNKNNTCCLYGAVTANICFIQVIAIVMDIFTDPDIFLDLHEAATRRMVPVYIILSSHHLSAFLHMVETTGVNVRFTEVHLHFTSFNLLYGSNV